MGVSAEFAVIAFDVSEGERRNELRIQGVGVQGSRATKWSLYFVTLVQLLTESVWRGRSKQSRLEREKIQRRGIYSVKWRV